jgi:hypothetical protein
MVPREHVAALGELPGDAGEKPEKLTDMIKGVLDKNMPDKK